MHFCIDIFISCVFFFWPPNTRIFVFNEQFKIKTGRSQITRLSKMHSIETGIHAEKKKYNLKNLKF